MIGSSLLSAFVLAFFSPSSVGTSSLLSKFWFSSSLFSTSSFSSLFALSESAARILIERILNALPEGMLVAAFAWVLLRVLRKESSGTRFAVWFLALLTVAALPFVGGLGDGRIQRALGLAGMSPGAWGSMRPAIDIPARWGIVVFLAWAFGASVAMTRLAVGLWHLRRMRQSCTAVNLGGLDPAVQKTVEGIVSSAGWAKSVTIATSESVRVPAAIGLWKRTIILPAWALRELAAEDLNVILLHEFAHLRRGDDWTNLIQKIVRGLFFFHPAVWWIDSRLSVEREMACDDAVLAETANPHGYATCLVSLLEKSLAHRVSQQRWSMAQAAVRRAHEATLRLARILDSNRPMATRVWKPALGMIGAFAVVCLMALPVAPQFVAFERGAGAEYSAASQQNANANELAALRGASVVPASLRMSENSTALGGVRERRGVAKSRSFALLRMTKFLGETKTPPVKNKVARARQSEAVGNLLSARSETGLDLNPTSDAAQVVAISASEEDVAPPQFQTVVFFETTRFVMPDNTVWNVQVWRVMMVTFVEERAARVPATKAI